MNETLRKPGRTLVRPQPISSGLTLSGVVLYERGGEEAQSLRKEHKAENDEEIYWIESSQMSLPSAEEFLNSHGYFISHEGGSFKE